MAGLLLCRARDSLASGGFVRGAKVDVANLAALYINGRFSRCGAAKNIEDRIAALARNCGRRIPDWARSRLAAVQRVEVQAGPESRHCRN